MLTLGGSAPRLPRESQVCVLRPGEGLDPELQGSPNSGGSPQEERPGGEARRQDLRGAELGKRKPPSLSLSPESRSAGQSRCALPPAPGGEGLHPIESLPLPPAPLALVSPLGWLTLCLLGSRGEGRSGCCPLPRPSAGAPRGAAAASAFPECQSVSAAPSLDPGFVLWFLIAK